MNALGPSGEELPLADVHFTVTISIPIWRIDGLWHSIKEEESDEIMSSRILRNGDERIFREKWILWNGGLLLEDSSADPAESDALILRQRSDGEYQNRTARKAGHRSVLLDGIALVGALPQTAERTPQANETPFKLGAQECGLLLE